MKESKDPISRLVHMDSVRVLMIIGVVFYHAMMAYCDHSPWWPVQDERGRWFGPLLALVDSSLLPVLFLLSGYFIPPSLDRRSTGGFILSKLKRLGIPLVLLTIFANPLLSFIRHLRVSADPSHLWKYWLDQLSTATDLAPTYLAGNATAHRLADHLSLWHLWFISLLLAMTIVAALIHQIRKARNGSSQGMAKRGGRKGSRSRLFIALVVAFVGIAVTMAVVGFVTPPRAWLRIGPFMTFQPVRVPLYTGLFILGAYLRRNQLLKDHRFPGATWIWGIIWIALFTFQLVFIRWMTTSAISAKWVASSANGALRASIAIAAVGFLINFCSRFWGRPTKVVTSLGASSYNIYLIHLVFVLGAQLLLKGVEVSIYLKAGAITVSTSVVCWLLSDKLIRPHPRISVALLVVAFAATLLWFQ